MTLCLSTTIIKPEKGKISAFDIGDSEWIDAESPMILERNQKTVKKIIKQMGL